MNDITVNKNTFTPTNFTEAASFCEMIANSDLVPSNFKRNPGNVFVAMQMGAEVGLSPMQAIQNIAVINGRPCLWGDAVLGIVRSHPDFEWIKETNEKDKAICEIKRKGQDPHRTEFSIDDAKKAGLWGKPGPWTQYEKRMLQMRARGFCCRDTFPDALKGLRSAEEEQDFTVSNPLEAKKDLPQPETKELEKLPDPEFITDMMIKQLNECLKFLGKDDAYVQSHLKKCGATTLDTVPYQYALKWVESLDKQVWEYKEKEHLEESK